MTPSDPETTRANTEREADAAPGPPPTIEPIVLVAQIAERLPELSRGELDELADAVEALTDAIGLRIDWSEDDSKA